ncbi:TetR/AcrR family transcriptional regulator [Novacetimonas cocois]|uniref:TetR/AcrR family transcriptional regulator n=1 Tax=Novacetimonas cocois TaxID=1747507 RepID=A0A365YWU9_9PROT|nr:TetR/AcrR family transcriptional regulator [Novacetimonas cocois]RBM06751.1 TetR/AcrR family transcriptional regulator [Novacetimonas cocois]
MAATPMQSATRLLLLEQAWPLVAQRGFASTSINDVLAAAHVPKGSFYYYFASKDVFGQELLRHGIAEHVATLRGFLSRTHLSGRDRLMEYWSSWVACETGPDPRQKCLIVKIGAEVSEFSEDMRRVMVDGIEMLVSLLDGGIRAGVADGSICPVTDPADVARELFHYWLGNAVAFRIHREPGRLARALRTTRDILMGVRPYRTSAVAG